VAGRVRWTVAVVAALLVAASVAAIGHADKRSAAASERPNVVVIQVDDMRTDELQYLTQTLDLLRGTNFTNSFVSTSLCCPSRAAFLTGQYTQNNKVASNGSYLKFNNTNTLATWLHADGYFTSIVGKYLNGYSCSSANPPGWDHWQALCANLYGMYKYSIKDRASIVKYGSTTADYQTDVIAKRSIDTINEAAASDKPFFLYLTPTAPHAGTDKTAPTLNRVAPRFANALSDYHLPTAPNFNEADVSDKPGWVQVLPSITSAQQTAIEASELTRIRMLLAVDDLVAGVVNQLAVTGKLATTDIIFTSDNGFALGEHRVRFGKEVEFNEVLSVPLLMSGPDFPVGDNASLVQNTDLAPTIVDLTGATAARVMDGLSVMPVVNGTADWSGRAIRHYITSDATVDNSTLATPLHPNGNGIRVRNYAYYELPRKETELYDHATDPYELNNVAGQASYAPLQAKLHTMLAALKTCAGASCQLDLNNIPPASRATATCADLVCSFDGTNSFDMDGTVDSYSWAFGDGTTGSGPTPMHDYGVTGSYVVTLTVTDNGGATSTDSLTVSGTSTNVKPVAAFSHTCVDLSCVFDSSASHDLDGTVVAYAWKFGDLTTSTEAIPSHSYATAGTKTVTLTVTDDRGAKTSVSHSVIALAPNILPIARFTVACTGRSCTFNSITSTDSDGTIKTRSWDFDDGLGTGISPTHLFKASGVYAVTLAVTDNRGGVGTVTIVVSV
jgi:arylsulfatase A-like enzyme/PKD repeat protein